MGSKWSWLREQQRSRLVVRGAAPEVATPCAWAYAPLLDDVPVSDEVRLAVKEERRSFLEDAKGIGGHGDLEYLCRLVIRRYVAIAREHGDLEHERVWTAVLCGQNPGRPAVSQPDVPPRLLTLGERRLGRVGTF